MSPAHPQDTPGKPIAGGTIVAKLRNADGTKVIGTALGMLANLDNNPSNAVMCIRDLYINPRYRKKGNATEIVNALCRWGYNQGSRIAVVDLLVDNHPSVKLFTSCGFVKICEYEFWEYNKSTLQN